MQKILICFMASVFVISANAQSLSPTVIASAGGYSSGGGISLSGSVGEVAVIQTFSNISANVILTQGFEQPTDIVNGLLDIERGADGTFSVYPIPTHDIEWYGYEFGEAGKVEISMYNMMGQKMDYSYAESYTSGKTVHSFNFSSYAAGNYILTVKFIAASGQEKIFRKKIEAI